jgi:formylmethanofuran dehydrogenase subunit C
LSRECRSVTREVIHPDFPSEQDRSTMPLTLTWKGPIGRSVDGDDLRPETLTGPSDVVARIQVPAGNSTVELGELFRIEGDGSDGLIFFEGDLRAVRGLGTRMTSGRLVIRGDVGPRLGSGMSGGSIEVEGSAGTWAGAEIRGGLIRIKGDAGDLPGASLPGSRLGMRGGVILVDGRAGDDVGLAMRRGLIAVRGNLGSGAGRGMIAGSIFGFGSVGRGVGRGMKRGTLALFGLEGRPDFELSPTFEPSGTFRPHVLNIYLAQLRGLGFDVPAAAFAGSIRRYNGDRLEAGRGEILLGP